MNIIERLEAPVFGRAVGRAVYAYHMLLRLSFLVLQGKHMHCMYTGEGRQAESSRIDTCSMKSNFVLKRKARTTSLLDLPLQKGHIGFSVLFSLD